MLGLLLIMTMTFHKASYPGRRPLLVLMPTLDISRILSCLPCGVVATWRFVKSCAKRPGEHKDDWSDTKFQLVGRRFRVVVNSRFSNTRKSVKHLYSSQNLKKGALSCPWLSTFRLISCCKGKVAAERILQLNQRRLPQ